MSQGISPKDVKFYRNIPEESGSYLVCHAKNAGQTPPFSLWVVKMESNEYFLVSPRADKKVSIKKIPVYKGLFDGAVFMGPHPHEELVHLFTDMVITAGFVEHKAHLKDVLEKTIKELKACEEMLGCTRITELELLEILSQAKEAKGVTSKEVYSHT
jgi:hypothetical protein